MNEETSIEFGNDWLVATVPTTVPLDVILQAIVKVLSSGVSKKEE